LLHQTAFSFENPRRILELINVWKI
jgi:hypothetical protein